MPIFSLHEHELKQGVDEDAYRWEVAEAIKRLQVPGLLKALHLQGFKGVRNQGYGVLWVFEDQETIVKNFGTAENPSWPEDWLYYENEVLAKYLDRHPDTVDFTGYKILTEVEFS